MRFFIFFLFALTVTAAELNTTRIVLYKHGVGYFERAGDIPSGESAVLQFKASEMNDVLKSLTIAQQGGDGVSAVRYDSSDPLAKRLEVFPFRIGGSVTLADILDQFKGAEIRLQMGAGDTTGTIVSARRLPATDNAPERQKLVLLSGGAFRTVDPEAASEIAFTDPKIQQQFTDYLALLSRSRNTDKRTVTIESQGGATRVAASYISPTPIWKSTYRLVFDAQDEPLLEGWAIVDNTSGEDWENVGLSLVSGLPVSFISKLYEPRYLSRPVVQLAQDRAWTPTVHGGAMDKELDESGGRRPGVEGGGGVIGGVIGGMGMGGALPAPPHSPAAKLRADRAFRQTVAGDFSEALSEGPMERRNELFSTVAATAVKAELGELFEYAIDHPVTIRKSESAMLPFFRERVDARRLYIYDESNGSQHPLTAAEITNTSGATLDGGAITVYDANAYAGEALVETVKAGDKRLISYAVDLGTRITTKFDSSRKLQSEFHLRRGILKTKIAMRETKTFTIRNVDAREKTLIIEHPVRPGYKLIDLEPAEKTASAYRFEVTLDPDSSETFAIVEERIYSETHGIHNLSYEQLLIWVNNKELSEEGREQLGRIAELKRQQGETQRELQRVDQRVNDLNQDQNRLRNNISTLRNVAGQQEKVMQYSESLASQEGELVELRDRQQSLREQADRLQREADQLIETLSF